MINSANPGSGVLPPARHQASYCLMHSKKISFHRRALGCLRFTFFTQPSQGHLQPAKVHAHPLLPPHRRRSLERP